MKKFLLSALMFLTTLSASAQLISAARDNDGVKFGVRGSFALSNMNQDFEEVDNEFGSSSMKQLPAFALGVAMDLPVLESLHFNVELKYVMKGDKYVKEGKGDNKFEEKDVIRMGYVEMPIQPQFRLNFSDAAHLNVNFGPYIALAIHGHEKEVTKQKGEDDYVGKFNVFTCKGYEKEGKGKKEKYDLSDEMDPLYSRFDAGLAMGVDFVIEHFHIGVGYDLGLKDINNVASYDKDDDNYQPTKNRSWLFTIGIDF